MTAGGLPACTPAPTIATPLDRTDAAIGAALATMLGRRSLLGAAVGGLATVVLAACQAESPAPSPTPAAPTATPAAIPTLAPTPLPPTSSPPSPTSAPTATSTIAPTAVPTIAAPTATLAATAAPTGKSPWIYVFNVGSQDVTLIDTATNKVVATRPLGAAVRWLSNEQTYWDGANVWTYDFPDNKLKALAIDPKAVKVVRTIDTGTLGPGHSLMLTSDRSTALLNAAGSNVINVIDVKSGQVADKIATGQFP